MNIARTDKKKKEVKGESLFVYSIVFIEMSQDASERPLIAAFQLFFLICDGPVTFLNISSIRFGLLESCTQTDTFFLHCQGSNLESYTCQRCFQPLDYIPSPALDFSQAC